MSRSTKKTIFLIGPMASGKTTVGTLLAKQLKTSFSDIDLMVCHHFGMTVPEIFASKGEDSFRLCEKKMLSECTDPPGAVVATGGGAVVLKASREIIANGIANGSVNSQDKKLQRVVIYLKTSIAAQLKRLAGQNDRPLIAGKNKRQVLARLAQERNHYYQELADLVLLTDDKSPAMLVQETTGFLSSQDLQP